MDPQASSASTSKQTSPQKFNQQGKLADLINSKSSNDDDISSTNVTAIIKQITHDGWGYAACTIDSACRQKVYYILYNCKIHSTICSFSVNQG